MRISYYIVSIIIFLVVLLTVLSIGSDTVSNFSLFVDSLERFIG